MNPNADKLNLTHNFTSTDSTPSTSPTYSSIGNGLGVPPWIVVTVVLLFVAVIILSLVGLIMRLRGRKLIPKQLLNISLQTNKAYGANLLNIPTKANKAYNSVLVSASESTSCPTYECPYYSHIDETDLFNSGEENYYYSQISTSHSINNGASEIEVSISTNENQAYGVNKGDDTISEGQQDLTDSQALDDPYYSVISECSHGNNTTPNDSQVVSDNDCITKRHEAVANEYDNGENQNPKECKSTCISHSYEDSIPTTATEINATENEKSRDTG